MPRGHVGLILAIALVAIGTAVPPARSGPVGHTTSSTDSLWFWFGTCKDPRLLALEGRLDNRVLLRRVVPVCYQVRDRILDSIQAHTRVTFTFRAPRRLVWTGYRSETGETTSVGVRFEVDIWEAGADSDAMTLGVSATTRDTIYMNTLHNAQPDGTDTTELAAGLTIITRPIRVWK